ncbi:hypothetical protein [Streptomyces sp. IMTB 2501]|nr:hypothetical protein [Streptomyces sp. IMTB 2501]
MTMAQWTTTQWPGDRAASERAHRTVDGLVPTDEVALRALRDVRS